VSKLTDLEICKRIAEIEGFGFAVDFNGDFTAHDSGWLPYNLLTDDELCFQLMVKYKVDIMHEVYGHDSPLFTCRIYTDPEDNPISEAFNESPSKAICLAIIEAHK